jgi:hypothetical protein
MPPEKANNVTDAPDPARPPTRMAGPDRAMAALRPLMAPMGPAMVPLLAMPPENMDSVTDSPSPAWPPTKMATPLADIVPALLIPPAKAEAATEP